MRKLKLIALAAALFGASAANAGALLSATYSQTLQGVPLVFHSSTATGTLVGNSFTLDAGSWFAAQFCIVNPGALACSAGAYPPAPGGTVIPNPAGPFAPPVVGINVTFTMNGAVSGTTADPTITAPSGIMGLVRVIGKIGKAPAFTLLPIVVNAGAGGTLTIPDPVLYPYPTYASLQVQLKGDVWHIGQVTQTGLTTAFAPLPDAVATGSVMAGVTSMGANTIEVNLVSLSRVRIRGLAVSDTSTPSYLKLVYLPEPGTLMLLGAGIAGLVMVGRRKLR